MEDIIELLGITTWINEWHSSKELFAIKVTDSSKITILISSFLEKWLSVLSTFA